MLSVRTRLIESRMNDKETTIYLDGEPICRAITDTLSTKNDAEEFENYLKTRL